MPISWLRLILMVQRKAITNSVWFKAQLSGNFFNTVLVQIQEKSAVRNEVVAKGYYSLYVFRINGLRF